MKKKLVSVLLALTMALALVTPALAAGSDADAMDAAFFAAAEDCARQLYELGLFRGTGTNGDGTPVFSLESEARRDAAVTMIVRLLGAEEEALAAHCSHPFTDAGWASDYIGYAYRTGITNGTSDTTFGSTQTIVRSQFVTLILRAMGYSGVDYKDPYPLADEVGLYYGGGSGENCERAYLAIISLSALTCPMADGSGTLYSALEARGVFDGVDDPAMPALPTLFGGGEETSEEPLTQAELLGCGPLSGPMVSEITVRSIDEMLLALDEAVSGSTSEIIVNMPAGKEEAYIEAFSDAFLDGRFCEAGALTVSYIPGRGRITLTLEYCGAVQVMAWLEGKTDTLSEDAQSLLDAALALKNELYYEGITDYEALKAIHNYLVNHTTYRETGDRSHDAIGALVDGYAVCEGYAEAFDLMCYFFGIDCIQVAGTARDNGKSQDHKWNIVLLDGAWYHVDVTWDDPVSSVPVLRFDYFLLSDAEMGKDHQWTAFPDIPLCEKEH